MNANGLVQTAALLESGRAAVPSTSTSLEAALLAGDRTPTFFELLAPSSLPLPEAAIQLDEELSAAEPPDNKESDSARDGWLELLAHVTGSQPAQASPVRRAVN